MTKTKKIINRRSSIEVDTNVDVSIDQPSSSGSAPGALDIQQSTSHNLGAVAIWRKWSNAHGNQPNNIPFGVRGRRRNSMFAHRNFMAPIAEVEDENV